LESNIQQILVLDLAFSIDYICSTLKHIRLIKQQQMKKILLSSASMLIAFAGISQQSVKLTPEQNEFKLEAPAHFFEQQSTDASALQTPINTQPVQRSLTETQIGESYYDLQTNSSIQRRILNHTNGTITATWTFSTDAAWTARGTGYNFYNGSSWGSIPTVELETERVGWPNPLKTGSGKEIVISHSTASSIYHRVQRNSVGSGTWTQGNLSSQSGQVWGRSSTGGTNNNSIHMVGMTLPVANNGSTYAGMDGAFLYTRSTNSGTSFDIVDYQIPGTNVNYFDGFDGDSYAIDAQGDNVAVVVGGLGRGVQLFKSTNGGVNWTKTDVMTSAVWFNEASTVVDTTLEGRLWTSDGSVTVLLDENNMAHVWFGTMFIANADITDGTITYYPYTNGIEYWTEDFPSDNSLRMFGMLDLNANGQLDIDNPGGQYRFSGLVSHPEAGIDEDDCIYLSYTSVREDLTNGTQNYRHTYVTKSCDGGCSWSFPIDVTGGGNNNFVECAYPSIARHVDDDIHIVYMADIEPGIAVSGDMDASGVNKIIYLKEDVTRFDTVDFCPTEIAGDSMLCGGGSVELEALGCASVYAWTGPNSFTSSSQVISASAVGTYTCVMTTTCGSQTETFNVVAYSGTGGPVVTIGASTLEICSGGSAVLTATSNIGGVGYVWSTGATTAATTVTAAGTYTVTVSDCNSGTTVQSITVGTPAAPQAIVSGDLTLCPGDNNELTALPWAGATYLWSNGQATANTTVTAAGTYTVTVTNCAGNATATATVVMESLPVAEIVDNGTTGCEGDILTVTAIGGSTFEWSTGSTDPSLSITEVSQSGTYTVTVMNDCGDEDETTVTLTISAAPSAPVLSLNGANYSSSQTGAGTHEWYIEGTLVAGQSGNTLPSSAVGENNSVYCIFIDENGCESEASNTIVGLNEVTNLNNSISIFPNPNNGQFEIRFGDVSGKMVYTVTNALGQVVAMNQINAQSGSIESINLNDVQAGAYQLKVAGEAGISIQSIIIE